MRCYLDDHLYTVFEMPTHPDVSGKLVDDGLAS